MRDLHCIADAPPLNWVKIENAPSIQRVVALLIPGIPPTPPPPTSATAKPHTSRSRNRPQASQTFRSRSLHGHLPILAHSAHQATNPECTPCSERSSKDLLAARKKSTNQSPISMYAPLFPPEYLPTSLLVVELAFNQDPSLYLLSLQWTIENDYPIPSYMADVFDKPDGWV